GPGHPFRTSAGDLHRGSSRLRSHPLGHRERETDGGQFSARELERGRALLQKEMRRVLLLVLAVALGGCGKKAATSNQPSRLVLVNFSDPKTFNPTTAAETSSRDIV